MGVNFFALPLMAALLLLTEVLFGATKAYPPSLSKRDHWISVDLRDGSEILREVVKKNDGVYIIQEITKSRKKESKYDAELNPVVGGDKKLDFPLYVGKVWSWKKNHSDNILVGATFEVLSQGARRVPAGSFEAFEIKAVMQPYYILWGIKIPVKVFWTGVIEFWYAPCVGNIIEVRHISGEKELQERITPEVLKSYEYKNAPSECD